MLLFICAGDKKKKKNKQHTGFMFGIISLWLKTTGSFTAIFIWGFCKCLGLLGGTVLRSVTKVTEPSPRRFVVPKDLPLPKTETAVPVSEAFLGMKSKLCSHTLLFPSRLTAAPGCAVLHALA